MVAACAHAPACLLSRAATGLPLITCCCSSCCSRAAWNRERMNGETIEEVPPAAVCKHSRSAMSPGTCEPQITSCKLKPGQCTCACCCLSCCAGTSPCHGGSNQPAGWCTLYAANPPPYCAEGCALHNCQTHPTTMNCTIPCTSCRNMVHTTMNCTIPCTSCRNMLHTTMNCTIPCTSCQDMVHTSLMQML
jgi:hypothetical protein